MKYTTIMIRTINNHDDPSLKDSTVRSWEFKKSNLSFENVFHCTVIVDIEAISLGPVCFLSFVPSNKKILSESQKHEAKKKSWMIFFAHF